MRDLEDGPLARVDLHWSLGGWIRNRFIHAGNARRYGLESLATLDPDGFSGLIIGCYLRHVRGEDPRQGVFAGLCRVGWVEPDERVMTTAVSLLGEQEALRQADEVRSGQSS